LKEWEEAVTEFLKDWKNNNDVTGAMICGSYITGNPSKRSDIDIHIILSDDIFWRERGNKLTNGFLVEYFANPPKQIREYFREDFHDHSTMSMVQFITGKILFDNTGVINELKIEAKEWLEKKHDGLNDTLLELKKYAIWDDLDNLKDCFEQQRVDFYFIYSNSLLRLFKAYCAFLKLEDIPYYQIFSYLSDPKYLDKYLKKCFQDEVFKLIFIKGLQEVERNKMMECYEQLSQYVLNQMGGFVIDGWRLKSRVEI
jgi:hypothetical protein